MAASGILAAVMREGAPTTDPVELVRMQFEALNRRDLNGVMSSVAEDAVMVGRMDSLRVELQYVASFPNGSRTASNWTTSLRRSVTSAVGLCLQWRLRSGVWSVAPVVFDNARDGSTSGRGADRCLTTLEVDEGRAAAERLAEERA